MTINEILDYLKLNVRIEDDRIINSISFTYNSELNDVFLSFSNNDLFDDKKIVFSSYASEKTIYIEDLKMKLTPLLIWFNKIDITRFKLIAITGTEMKTSLAKLLFDIYNQSSNDTMLISTAYKGKHIYSTPLTTPDASSWVEIFKYANENKIKKIIYEASSIGIMEGRVNSINPDIIFLTNLYEDHLDYHKTLSNYYHSKEQYINKSKLVILNRDDENKIKISTHKEYIDNYEILSKNYPLKVKINNHIYEFTNLNELQIKLIPYILKLIEIEKINADVEKLKYPEGRIEQLNSNPLIILDYAHTENSFLNICKYFFNKVRGKKYVLFGAGGNRQKEKRKKYGEIASTYMDYIILTEDNSRDEDLDLILNDIIQGISIDYHIVKDRKKALKYALSLLNENDGLLLIGKGVENYILRKNKKIKYNEKVEVGKLLHTTKKID